MEITADNINVSSDDPAVSRQTPAGGRAVTVRWLSMSSCRQITPGSPSGVLTENGGCPCGRLWVFFRQLHPKFPRVAERRPAGDWEEHRGAPADELIGVTSADHPAKFNCELKCSGRLRISKGWALQECLFWRRPPDFCRIWCKSRRAAIWRSIFLYWDGTLIGWGRVSYTDCFTRTFFSKCYWRTFGWSSLHNSPLLILSSIVSSSIMLSPLSNCNWWII